MGRIDDGLGVGQAMDRRDGTMLDTQLLVDDLHHRRQAVGGAGSGGDNMVIGRVKNAVVHAHHNVFGPSLFHRSGHHHALYALLEIRLEHVHFLHFSAGLNHQIAAGPVRLSNGFIAGDANRFTLDNETVAAYTRFVVPAAVDTVEVQQMRQRLGISARIVDRYELHLRPLPRCPQGQAADSAESINSDFDLAHDVLQKALSIKYTAQPACRAWPITAPVPQ